MRFIKLYAVLIGVSTMLYSFPQDSVLTISRLKIEEKKNGILVYAYTSGSVDKNHVSGWTTENNWAYFTIYKAQSDTSRLNEKFIAGPVLEVEASNTNESTQIAVKLRKSVNSVQYFIDEKTPGISFTLGFPDGVMAVAKKVSEIREEENLADDTQAITSYRPWYSPLKKSLYLTGTIMTIAGVLSSDKSSSGANETMFGLGILGSTYIFDKFIYPKLQTRSKDE